jgi:hypothetical protein
MRGSEGVRRSSGTKSVQNKMYACKLLIFKEFRWWPGTESNRRRQPFQGCALPTELPGHFGWVTYVHLRWDG